jgi:hypothetical protein
VNFIFKVFVIQTMVLWDATPYNLVDISYTNPTEDISTGYGLDDREVGVRVPVGSRIITSPCRPDRLWGPPNLLYNGYRELFPGGKAAGA